MQPVSGAREAALFGDRNKRCELAQFHVPPRLSQMAITVNNCLR
jgi:hypothetical protein